MAMLLQGWSLFCVFVLLLVLDPIHADPEYCNRGFKIAGKYHECWIGAAKEMPFTGLLQPHSMYTARLVEEYATHMCSVVKPVALACLEKEVAKCSNSKKIVDIADESGGACTGNHLNSFFKTLIIDHLSPVPGNSSCFTIADSSYECYVSAGQKIMQSGDSTVDISRFHKVADKFFNYIWDCHIQIFKSNVDICEHWQLPMLLALQRTAMPSLFGMRLNNYQVSKLELGGKAVVTTTTPLPDTGEGKPLYLMLQVLASKDEAGPDDVVLELGTSGQKTQITVAKDNTVNQDVSDFVGEIVDSEGKLSLAALRKKVMEQRKKQKEISDYLKRIKNAERQRRRKLYNKNKSTKTEKDNTSVDGMID